MNAVGEWTNEQLDLAIEDAYIPRIPGQVNREREALVALRVARARIAELEAERDANIKARSEMIDELRAEPFTIRGNQ